MFFHKFENKYIVKGTLKAISPIHIGTSKDNFDPLQSDNAVIRDNDGKPYIPGSSLKGVLRSYMEALLGSGLDFEYRSCFIVNSPCLDEEKVKDIKDKIKKRNGNNLNNKELAEEIYSELCDVCKIFGCNHFASKLKIRDCSLKDEKFYIEKKDGVVIDRDTGTSLDGRKYDFEQVAAGTKFNFYMTIENLDKEHEELLKLMINLLKNGELKVGGKTSVGLGGIKLTKFEVYKITKNNLKEYVFNGLKKEMRWDNV